MQTKHTVAKRVCALINLSETNYEAQNKALGKNIGMEQLLMHVVHISHHQNQLYDRLPDSKLKVKESGQIRLELKQKPCFPYQFKRVKFHFQPCATRRDFYQDELPTLVTKREKRIE